MKICVFIIFQLCPWIIRVGDWALRWTEGNQTLQIFFVMLFFPVVMNALQYYIIDAFIKNQKPTSHEPIPSDDVGDGDTDNSQDDFEAVADGEEEAALIKKENDARVKEKEEREARSKADPKKLDEYDPAFDGASSSSGVAEEQDKSQRPSSATNPTSDTNVPETN